MGEMITRKLELIGRKRFDEIKTNLALAIALEVRALTVLSYPPIPILSKNPRTCKVTHSLMSWVFPFSVAKKINCIAA